MRNRKKSPRKGKRNFGYGRSLVFAFRCAIDAFFGSSDHFGTRRTHKMRIRIFAGFCRRYGIVDATLIDAELLVAFGHYLQIRVKEPFRWTKTDVEKPVSVAYAHNLISTVNTVLFAMRNDHRLKISARSALGVARSYIRETEIKADVADAKTAVDLMVAKDLHRGAAVVFLSRAWGMRVQEALLQDLDRVRREVAATGTAAILEGTKGGRRCRSRTIEAGELQKFALDFALAVRPERSRCLLSETDNVKSFLQTELNRCRRILRSAGIPSFRELRAGFAQDVYEEEMNGPSPLKSPITDKARDHAARQKVSRLLGHARPHVASGYIGGCW